MIEASTEQRRETNPWPLTYPWPVTRDNVQLPCILHPMLQLRHWQKKISKQNKTKHPLQPSLHAHRSIYMHPPNSKHTFKIRDLFTTIIHPAMTNNKSNQLTIDSLIQMIWATHAHKYKDEIQRWSHRFRR